MDEVNQTNNTQLDRDRFRQLWIRCAGDTGAGDHHADVVFRQIVEYYREPHRYYHTAVHIKHCLTKMDMAAGELGHSDSVELAIWFHDVIYISGAKDNEHRSAEWFAEKAHGILPEKTIRQVERYIMSTTHGELPDDEGSKYVVDLDLSGFGLPPEQFMHDGENVRKEFANLSDAEFIRGQSCFLRKLLDRSHIFSTSYFFSRYENQARRNISDTLEHYAEWYA